MTVLILLVAVGALVYFGSKLNYSDFADLFHPENSTATDDAGFPKKLFGERVVQFEDCGSLLAMATDSKLLLIRENGATAVSLPHSYGHPTMACSGQRVLLYDRGGNHFRLDTATGTAYEQELANEVICGDINSSGTAAIATTEERYAGAVTVYHPQNRELFKWYSADARINAVALRDDGLLAVSCIGAENGVLCSTVYLMNISRGEEQEVPTVVFRDMIVLSVTFQKNGLLRVIGDTETATVAQDGSVRSEYRHSKNLIGFADESDERAVLLLSPSAYAEERELVCLNENAEAIGSYTIRDEVKKLRAVGKRSYLLSDGKLICFNERMEPEEEKAVRTDTRDFALIGSRLYFLGLGELSTETP